MIKPTGGATVRGSCQTIDIKYDVYGQRQQEKLWLRENGRGMVSLSKDSAGIDGLLSLTFRASNIHSIQKR